MDDAEPV
jgi:hypothetical protein